MSELFDNDPRRMRVSATPPPRRSRALLITGAVMVVLFIALTGFSAFWTERLWFSSVGFAGVFSTLIWTRVLLFVVFGALMGGLVAASVAVAYRFSPRGRIPGPQGVVVERYRQAVAPVRGWVLAAIAVTMALFSGGSASGQWRTYLLWRNGSDFGSNDPYFGRDLGFYVFDLPWLHFMVDFAMAVAVVAALAAVVVYYLFGGIRLQGGGNRFSGAAQVQLSVLLGVLMLFKAVDYWLDRFDLLTDSGGLTTGMNYTDDNAVLPARNILIGIAVIVAVLFFINVWRRTWSLPTVGVGLLVLSSILMGVLWPSIVQRFQVKPAEPDKEAPYIQRNIEATRAAFNIEGVDESVYPGTVAVEPSQLRQTALQTSIRLVDPALVNATFEQKQQVKGYYTVADVLDVDRYNINGTMRDVVVAVREMDQTGIPADSQNWNNLHTVYTHGYGMIAAYGNQRNADNEEAAVGQTSDGGSDLIWAEENLPPDGEISDLAGPDGYRGQLYFGESADNYAIVGKAPGGSDVELDLPEGAEGGQEQTSTYEGEAGVPVGSLWRKVLYGVRFSEPNIILSSRVHENSKIIYDRQPRLMVEKVAPWLTVDRDPFPAMVDGRVVWVLDGYTTTDQYPLSEKESFESMTDDALDSSTQFRTLPTDEINYMRNAVKATVDAYDGTVKLYAWDESDPMLGAWQKVFPGTVLPKADIPEELISHLRYPEDLFKVQRYQLAAYHVDDAATFYKGSDRWVVPQDPNRSDRYQPPYRLSVKMPGETESKFSLTSVYTPNNRENLAAFLAVDAEAADTGEYGTMRLLTLRGGTQIPGPAQISNTFAGDQKLKDALLPYTNSSRVEYGNLLTLPVGEGLMYVQPIYTIREGGEGNYPLLQFVVVSFGNDQVGVGKTLGEAIAGILGEEVDTTPPDSGTPETGNGSGAGGETTGTLTQEVRRLLRQADKKFAEADELQRQGDTAGWAQALEEGRALVEQAIAAATDQQ